MKDNPIGPAAELRTAATLIRETSSRATSGPWSASAVWSPRSPSTSAVYSYAHPTGTDRSEVIPSMKATPKRPLVRPGDAEWIALMSPAVAGPLAAWLDGVAKDIDGHDPDGGCECTESDSYHRAMDFARSILGRTP